MMNRMINKAGWRAYGAALMMIVGALAGCVSARRSEPLTGALKEKSPAETRGEELFMRHCHECHPHGDAGIGPALNNKPLPGFMIKTQVRLGLGAMPSFRKSEISAAQLNDIVAYMKALRRQGPPKEQAPLKDEKKDGGEVKA